MKNSFILFFVLASCDVIAAQPSGSWNTWYGSDAGKDTKGSGNTYIGARTAYASTNNANTVIVGRLAGTHNLNATRSISIGYGTGELCTNNCDVVSVGTVAGHSSKNCTNCVFIGRNAGVGISNETGAVVIGDVLVHTNGITKIKGLSNKSHVTFNAQVFLSADGDDANDGYSEQKPKKTIAGCITSIEALRTNGVTVAVFDGEYSPPASDMQFTHSSNILFRSVNGLETTIIRGGTHSLRMVNGTIEIPRFQGFTLTGFTAGHNMFAVEFIDCKIKDNYFTADTNIKGVLVWCYFTRCMVIDNTFTGGAMNGGHGAFCNCFFNDSFVDNVSLPNMSAWGAGIHAENTVFKLPFSGHTKTYINNEPYFKNVTIIAASEYNPDGTAKYGFAEMYPKSRIEAYTNVLFVIAKQYNDYDIQSNNYFRVVNTCEMTADGTPANIDCPAVRDNGYPDWGCKNSGWGPAKTARKIYAQIAALKNGLTLNDASGLTNIVLRNVGGELNVSRITVGTNEEE